MSYFEDVEMVRTKDGMVFEDEQQAFEHVRDKICEEIDGWLKGSLDGAYEIRVQIKVCEALAGNMEKLHRLKALVNKYV